MPEEFEDQFSAEEPKLHEERSKAARAKTILDDPLVAGAFDNLEERYMQALRDAPLRDVVGLQTLKIMLATVSQVRQHLEEMIRTGKLADKRLEIIDRMREEIKAGEESPVSWFTRDYEPGEPV